MSEEARSIQERILDAARELFLTQGYNGSNLRDIAQKAQVSMGGIYHHFASKEEIYQALLSSSQLAGDIARVVALFRSPEFPENLAQVGAAVFESVRTHRDYFKLVYIDILEFQGRNVTPVIKAFRDSFAASSEQLLARRREAGELVDVHPAVIMRCIMDVYLHYYLEEIMLQKSLSKELGLTDEQLAGEMAKILLHGIMRREEPAS